MLHDALQEIDSRSHWYSDPHNMALLPFPMLYYHLPIDRFPLGGEPVKMFEYMGREHFENLWASVQSLQIGLGYSSMGMWDMGSPTCSWLWRASFTALETAWYTYPIASKCWWILYPTSKAQCFAHSPTLPLLRIVIRFDLFKTLMMYSNSAALWAGHICISSLIR